MFGRSSIEVKVMSLFKDTEGNINIQFKGETSKQLITVNQNKQLNHFKLRKRPLKKEPIRLKMPKRMLRDASDQTSIKWKEQGRAKRENLQPPVMESIIEEEIETNFMTPTGNQEEFFTYHYKKESVLTPCNNCLNEGCEYCTCNYCNNEGCDQCLFY